MRVLQMMPDREDVEMKLRSLDRRVQVLEFFSWPSEQGLSLKQGLALGGTVSLFALGLYSALRVSGAADKIKAASGLIHPRFGIPSLVRDVSFTPMPPLFKKQIMKTENVMCQVILPEELQLRVLELAASTYKTKLVRGFYRNVLMHGPPGTGKTLVAKNIAKSCGLDFAVLVGSEVALQGRNAVDEIHRVFDWAERSRRGQLLFVDEADSFLPKRRSDKVSEGVRAALNAFTYRSGPQSKKFMLVLSSNLPEMLDSAVYDRMDLIFGFPLPDNELRERLLRMYFRQCVIGMTPLQVGKFNYLALYGKLATLTRGMSGRQVAKLGVSWHAAALVSKDGKLTEQMVLDHTKDAVYDLQQMELWQSAEERAQVRRRSMAAMQKPSVIHPDMFKAAKGTADKTSNRPNNSTLRDKFFPAA